FFKKRKNITIRLRTRLFQCGLQLRDLRLYAQHFRRAHPDKNRTKYPAMKTPCMCEQCGRIFQSMALLKDHMWVHTGEKRFKCDRCEKSFTQKTNLVFHMRVHSATRPTYECPLCGKHFAFFNNRRRHMFIHTGLKPFKCDTCGKCFTTSGEQRAHVEHVHLKKPWPKRARARHCDDAWQKCGLRHVED
ncbi:LOW QUALITY PROTEIN: zinc finger protein 79-like, partial [Bicyclus anynana]|uniref:LOW QUALITY PROTEIN: zinc finger protein 79-like n=1 Tax=Bicyclus anynana TaxID=110368 RepID=A0ABM3M5Z5_BICAN